MEELRAVHVLLTVVTLVLSVTVHEYAHALAAWKLGDDYAARDGRLTLNPMAHADPVGTVLLPALGAMFAGAYFGWGKPVPYIPTNITRKVSIRAGEAIIAFAGPLANLITAVICGGLWMGLLRFQVIDSMSPFEPLLRQMMQVNVGLFFFNLLPVPPLDGSKIAAWIGGQRIDRTLDAIQRAGMVGLIAAIMLAPYVIRPLYEIVVSAIISTFALVFT